MDVQINITLVIIVIVSKKLRKKYHVTKYSNKPKEKARILLYADPC